jgi:hypothetical protein
MSVCLPINFWIPEQIFMKLGTWGQFNGVLHKSIPSVFVSMCVPLSLLGRGSVTMLSGHEYNRNSRRIVGRVVFYAVRVVARKVCDYFFIEFLWILFRWTLSFKGLIFSRHTSFLYRFIIMILCIRDTQLNTVSSEDNNVKYKLFINREFCMGVKFRHYI